MVTLDHVTLRTHALDETRDFLVALLDLEVGYRPDFGFPGYWLYAGNTPIVHLIPGPAGHVERNAEAIDHVGLRIDYVDGIRQRLDAGGTPYSEQTIAELGEHRLFTLTPTGILLELVARMDGPE